MAGNKNPHQTAELIISESMKLFLEKGYDKTSMQDIITATKLSKGGIYHHFASKEKIFETMCLRIGDDIIDDLTEASNAEGLNGAAKLKLLFKISMNNQKQEIIIQMMPNILENPRFLVLQFHLIQNVTGPRLLVPILEEGIKDGSIKANDPVELAELILVLVNIWLNPFIFKTTSENALKRFNMAYNVLKIYEIELFDEEMLEEILQEIDEEFKK